MLLGVVLSLGRSFIRAIPGLAQVVVVIHHPLLLQVPISGTECIQVEKLSASSPVPGPAM